MRAAYAFSTALISVFPQVGQGEGYSTLMGTTLRRLGGRDPEAMARIADALVSATSRGRRPARMRTDGCGVPLARHAHALSELGIARDGTAVLELSLELTHPKAIRARAELLGESCRMVEEQVDSEGLAFEIRSRSGAPRAATKVFSTRP
jgi:hypothetical protein